MDVEELEKQFYEEYRNNPSVPSNYMDVYYPNLLPRKNLVIDTLGYRLAYGGKTLLKEEKEYVFNGLISSAPSKVHLNGDLPEGGVLVSDREYMYDNLALHTNPTRIMERRTNGEKYITYLRIPLDFVNHVEPIVERMKEVNMVSKLVKQQSFVEKGGVNYLLSEDVTLYEELEAGSILPVQSLFLFSGYCYKSSNGSIG
ncbi:MAG: hypothetical protein LIO65_04055 [Odoribacter sp.]|nr:hypothetical protein [Odoribacter sp.]